MSTFSRIKTWISGDLLTAGDLNSEFNNLITGLNGSLNLSNIDQSIVPTWTGSHTFSAAADFNNAVTIKQAIPDAVNAGDQTGSYTVDWSTGNTFRIRLTGNTTLTFSNPGSWQRILLILQQDGTGSRLITWPTTVRWMNGTGATDSTTDKPTLTTTINKFDAITFWRDAVNSLYIGTVVGLKGAIT